MKRDPADNFYSHTPDLFTPSFGVQQTSREAAESIADSVDTLRAKVRAAIRLGDGLTCDEIEQRLHMRHQTASARVTELQRQGQIFDSGERRPTRSGRTAIIWRTT